jgi:hypothetical protein
MGLLGEMLIERGVLSTEQLHEGLAARRRGDERLGTYLMDLGFIDEGSLLQALAEQHSVPFISESALLEHLEASGVALLPETMLRSLRAVPFRQVRDRVQVAMSSPGDPRAIDRIANFTQLHVEPFVTTDRTIERAIQIVPKLREVEKERPEDLLTEVVYLENGAALWERLWWPQVEPSALLRTHSRPRAARVVLVASYPGLDPVGSVSARPAPEAIDASEFVQTLRSATTAAEVGENLVRFAAQYLDRVCLFAVHHGKISGWIGRGLPFDAPELRSFAAATTEPSLFRELNGDGQFTGQVPGGPINARLVDVFGQPPPTEVLLLSVNVKGRVKGYLVGDVPGRAVPDAVRDAIAPAAQAAGDALYAVLRGRL